MKLAAVILAVAVLLCVPALAEEPPVSVWILPFELRQEGTRADAADDDLGALVADLLAQSLSRSTRYAVVDRHALADVLAERRFSATQEPARLQWARWMLHGTVTRRPDGLVITAHVTDVSTTRILVSAEVASDPGSDEPVLLERMVRDVALELARIPTSARRPSEEDAIDASPTANLHFMRGLGHYHAGRHHRALAEFLRSATDPAVADLSALWRASCYRALGRYGHAYLELARLQRRRSHAIGPADLRRLVDECAEHLSDEELALYDRL